MGSFSNEAPRSKLQGIQAKANKYHFVSLSS